MNSIELLQEAKLSEARNLLIKEVKTSPSDTGKRTLLFQVLIFNGEWEKAERHLDIIASQNPTSEAGVQTYKNLIAAEKDRIEVSRLNQRPSFLPEAPIYFETYYEGLEKLVEKEMDEAKDFINQALAQRPNVSGTVNGTHFSGFSNTDTFLCAFLEAFVHERYVWIPFEAIKELSIPVPKTFFDLIWTSASLTTWEGLSMNCFLPVLYPDSFMQEDDRIRLGRLTEWTPLEGGCAKGFGQQVFQVGEEDMSILEIREVLFKFGGWKNDSTG